MSLPDPDTPAGEPTPHYFDEKPTVASETTTAKLTLPDLSVELVSDRGIFSRDRIDTGTRFLLLEGPPVPAAGDLLDLGCGYGPIAVTLARRAPAATVWAIDVNRRARDLCAANAERLGLTNIRVTAPDDVPDGVRFATIWSNPPIRIGKPALHDLLARWLGRLTPGGSAHLVVQRHLGADSLTTWLTQQGWPTQRRASRKGYRLLDVSAAPTPSPDAPTGENP